MEIETTLRNSGIDKVGKIPWGTHFCYFYYTIEELLSIIIPFITEGLKNNEVCIWVVPKNINHDDAFDLLSEELDANDTENINLKNQLYLMRYNDFYLECKEIIEKKPSSILKKIWTNVSSDNYDGIRLTGDVGWLKRDCFEQFITYESKIDKIKNELDILILCTYPINKFIKADVLSIANNHDFSLFERKNKIKVIKSSEREELEQERREIQLQIQNLQRINNIGVLTSSIAHDFNNLLSIIKSYADLARMEIESDEKIDSYLNEISISIKSSAKLIHRLLGYSKDQKETLEIDQINVNDIIRQLLEMMHYFIAENVIILTELDTNRPTIKGDEGKLEQIFINLIINARDALPDGGKIIIRTKHIKKDDLDKIPKKAYDSKSYLQIYVEDTGVGMDKETMNHIFQPFFTTKEKGKGTGLGLTIVRTFVEEHKGWIEIESEINKGSIFKVYLPTNLQLENQIS